MSNNNPPDDKLQSSTEQQCKVGKVASTVFPWIHPSGCMRKIPSMLQLTAKGDQDNKPRATSYVFDMQKLLDNAENDLNADMIASLGADGGLRKFAVTSSAAE